MSYKLFLDDVRNPIDCLHYMHRKTSMVNLLSYRHKDWVTVRNFNEFVEQIIRNGLPKLISFDHDLADEHYISADGYSESSIDFKEKTGYDCAKWLVEQCDALAVKLPTCIVHSMNPVGTERIEKLLKIRKG